MSRIKPLEARPPSSATLQAPPSNMRPACLTVATVPAVPRTQPGLPASKNAIQSNLVHSLGFFALAAYLISGQLNDWAIRLLGNKAYISSVTLLLLPVILVASGSALRPFQHRIGVFWAAFLGWRESGMMANERNCERPNQSNEVSKSAFQRSIFE